MKIAYEPHPIKPERKAELRKQGYKILDIAYKPADLLEEPEKQKRTPRPKVEQVAE